MQNLLERIPIWSPTEPIHRDALVLIIFQKDIANRKQRLLILIELVRASHCMQGGGHVRSPIGAREVDGDHHFYGSAPFEVVDELGLRRHQTELLND